MHGSTDAAGATAVQNTVRQGQASSGAANHTPRRGRALAESVGQSQRVGRGELKPSSQDDRAKNPGLGACSVKANETELRGLMEEPPGGKNHGRQARILDPEDSPHSYWQPLDTAGHVTRNWMTRVGGWRIVSIKGGDEEGGITSHRGVLAGDEYVDADALLAMVERELGFTIEQVRSVYRQGPMAAAQRELRGHIDARLLALSRSGANMALLGRLLGFKVEKDSHCEPLDNAIARAKAAELSSEGSQ